MKEYYLHSKEGNSFHFRRTDKEQGIYHSFTVSYAVDGTTTMTGDMGDLVWRRNYYPDGKHDYGFPFENTGIGYFAEKVSHSLYDSIRKFDENLAIKELEECFNEDEHSDEDKEKLQEMIKWNKWEDYSYQPIQSFMLYEDLCKTFPSIDWSEDNFGVTFTEEFRHQFEMLKSVSKLITDEVNNASKN